jgi:vacuolar-type H+-ATPase subunit I/STV1
MNDTIERYKQRQTLYKEKKSNLQDLYTKKEEVQDEIKQLEDRSDILNKSIETVKKLIDVLFNSKIEAFEELIQEGLNQIFIDREYQFDINLGSRGSKKTAGSDLPYISYFPTGGKTVPDDG